MVDRFTDELRSGGWSPQQYLKFADARLRPAIDLLARVPGIAPEIANGPIVDLGCGAGNVTRLLAERWPQAELLGVDSSESMLQKARAVLPRARWLRASIADWTAPAPPALIFSNAALHWLPDHDRLLPRLLQMLAPGGVLAVQMPKNFDAPSHVAIAETVRSGPWRQQLEPLLRPAPVAEPAAYFEMLQAHAAELDIWEQQYLQVLHGTDPVKEWTKGTWLKQFLDALAPADAATFEAEYAARVRTAYPPRADGRTLFPFRRLFLVARRRS
jgi:trans-aconitate 2-methyltransferase